MNAIDRIFDLVSKALDDIDNAESSLSSVIRKAIRIARLRNDYNNLWWLEYEMLPYEDNEARKRIVSELAPHYTKDEFNAIKKIVVESYISERRMHTCDEERNICGLSVQEIESRIEYFKNVSTAAQIPEGLNSIDLYFENKGIVEIREIVNRTILCYNEVLVRIKQRVYEFLSLTEKQLVYGQQHSDIFERNKEYVETNLRKLSPEAYEQFIVACRRLSDEDIESANHALLSCRRILKTIADKIYPARIEPVKSADGKERVLTEDKYIGRLWQFVYESTKGSTSGNLILSQITDLGNRIDRVYELSCKGVHAKVSQHEASQCIIQTYLVIGDILRLKEKRSALGEEDEEFHSISINEGYGV